jgi:hypothetical protein
LKQISLPSHNTRSEQEWIADIVAWGERLERHLSGVDRQRRGLFSASPSRRGAVNVGLTRARPKLRHQHGRRARASI